MLPNPRRFVKFFLGFQTPNTIPTYFHSFQIIATFRSTLFLSTIYQGPLILLLPKKVVGASLLKIWVENNVRKKETQINRFHLFKRRKEVKEDPCSEANGRRRRRFLCSEASGRRKRRFLCLKANGRKRRRFYFTSFHFPPKQPYLDLRFFPLILRFYFTMVLGCYLCISSLFLGL